MVSFSPARRGALLAQKTGMMPSIQTCFWTYAWHAQCKRCKGHFYAVTCSDLPIEVSCHMIGYTPCLRACAGLLGMFETRLKEQNPSASTLSYDTPALFSYLDDMVWLL
jgi:hypothetical protein